MSTALNDSGSRIRKQRKKLKLSQGALADRVGCHQVDVSRWESGAVPSALSLLKLSDALGVSMRWILTGRTKPIARPAA